MRSKITGLMNTHEIVMEMSEGNPGAATVMMGLLKAGPLGFMDVLTLDDMNIWGVQIWVAYKDYCGSEIEKLQAALKSRDPEMVKAINEQCPDDGPAVTSGASYKRPT